VMIPARHEPKKVNQPGEEEEGDYIEKKTDQEGLEYSSEIRNTGLTTFLNVSEEVKGK